MIKIRAPIWSDISGHSGASGGRFRFDFGIIWGAISGSRARDAKLAKIAPRHSESTIFGVPGVPKRTKHGSETNFQRQPGSKSVLGASGAQEISGTGSAVVTMACFGPGGGLNWGGKPASSYQCINVSRIQRQLVSIYQYNKDTWKQEATILRFSSILPKAPPQPGDPHKGGRRIIEIDISNSTITGQVDSITSSASSATTSTASAVTSASTSNSYISSSSSSSGY